MSVIALLNAEAGSTPSGTGSFTYFTNFRVLVENLAFIKLVGIWAMISYLAIGHVFHAALATPFQTTAKSGSLMYLTFKSTNLMWSTKCPVTLFGTTMRVSIID